MADIVPGDHFGAVEAATRERALEYVSQLVGAGRLDLPGFEKATEAVLAATNEQVLGQAIAALTPMVRVTPIERRMREPLVVSAGMQALQLRGRWQVASQIEVKAAVAKTVIDFTEATFDSPVTDVLVRLGMAQTTLIVPEWVEVQRTVAVGGVVWKLGHLPPLPGLPLIRLDVRPGLSKLVLRRPPQPRRRRLRKSH